MKDQVPFKGGDNHENAKIGWCHLKIFFSRTTGPGKLKFIWKLPDIVEIQVCSNHDPRGYDGATIGDQSFTYDYIGKIFFSRTTGPGKLKFIWKLPDMEEIQICSKYYPRGYDEATIGDQSLTYENTGNIFKNILLKNHWARKAKIYMKDFWYSGDSSLFKSWPRGYYGAPIGDQSFTYDYIGKIFKNRLLKNHWPGKLKFIWNRV